MPEPVQVAYKRVKLPKVGENGYGELTCPTAIAQVSGTTD